MHIFDDILYGLENKSYTSEQISQAYQEMFKDDSLVARIVLQDLIMRMNYNSNGVDVEANKQYHSLGQRSVIDYIKRKVLTPAREFNEGTTL